MFELIVGAVGMVVGVGGMIIAALTLSRNKRTDDMKEGKEDGMVLTELGYIKAGVDDLKRDGRDMRSEVQTLHDKMTRTEESCKQAHKRIDELQKYHQPN